MARMLTIYKPEQLTDLNKHFRDKATDNAIICAFSLKERCTPNCAACNVFGTHPKAECTRGGKDSEFEIGHIDKV